MSIFLKCIKVENFKSYGNMTTIPVSNLSVLMGANSSGKSTALQTLLVIKQTYECNSPYIDLLLSGKFVTLGDFCDTINDESRGYFSFGLVVESDSEQENYGDNSQMGITWKFVGTPQNEAKLSEMKFDYLQDNIKLVCVEDHRFQVFVNEKITPIALKINNLKLQNVYVNYNHEFNDLFYDFLNDMLKWLFPGKKMGTLEKKELVSLVTVEKLYYELLGRVKNIKRRDDSTVGEIIDKYVGRIIEDIDKYSKCQFPYNRSYGYMPNEIKENLLYSCISSHEDLDMLEHLLSKYEQALSNSIKKNQINSYDSIEEVDLSMLYTLGRGEKDRSTEADLISETFRSYKQVFNSIIRNIFYLGPIREKPQGLYNVGFEQVPKYVGPTGAYFASVLLRENKIQDYFLPNGEDESISLLDALDEWVNHLNVASEVKVEKKNSFGFSVSISNTQRRKSDIMNVGIGTSQVLPVLITGLLSEKGEYLLFEQPELHLHPYSQSRLADFFVELVKRGRKIIVETHSEYFILRLRYQILVNKISEKDIVVNFFQNSGFTNISQGILSGYGNLQYPDDFRDETQRLLDDIMKASLEKREH